MTTQSRCDLSEAAPFKIDGVYCRLIPLTKKMYAIVDADDFEALSQHKWYASWDRLGRRYYAKRTARVNGRRVTHWMHRDVLGLKAGDGRECDHVRTAETLDNRRANLREAKKEENQWNQGRRRRNTTGFKGVTYDKTTGTARKYRGVVGFRYRLFNTKRCATAEEAFAARRALLVALHGEFANDGTAKVA